MLVRGSTGTPLTTSGLPACADAGQTPEYNQARVATTAFVSHCADLAIAALDGRTASDTAAISEVAAQWARQNVAIESVLDLVQVGFRAALDLVIADVRKQLLVRDSGTAEISPFVDSCMAMFALQGRIACAVARAYVDEGAPYGAEDDGASRRLADALLTGRSTAAIARECGVEVAARYIVVSLSFSPPSQQNSAVHAPGQVFGRVTTELVACCGPRALPLLSDDGGTILLPVDDYAGTDFDDLVDRLSVAAQIPITAVLDLAERSDLPAASHRGHELLHILHQLYAAPGLHRFDDLALEYQITRPGPARDRLAALLAPLDDHPKLLATLRRYVGTEFDRRGTAAALGVHDNTVTYRLQRITKLTGADTSQPAGLSRLRAALVARSI